MADAETAGITDLVTVIDNGSDAPGTILDDCSEAFRRRYAEADLIIAKGQGNYEALRDSPRPLYFLLRVKCPIIARDVSAARRAEWSCGPRPRWRLPFWRTGK